VRPSVWDPTLYVRENLEDGVEISFVLPTQGCVLYGLEDRELFGAICHSYNDWISDFCRVVPDRLKGAAMINIYDPEEAVNELTRAKRMGLSAGIISVYPGGSISYDHPRYERLWSAAEELDMPLSMHSLTNHNGPYSVSFEKMTHSLRANCDHWVRMSISDMIFGGVFERHPKLKILSTEHEGGWVPYFLWQMDWVYERRIVRRGITSQVRRKPSEYFHDHVFVAIIFDRPAIEARDVIGVRNLMWGTDFPHDQSTHPRSREVASEVLDGVPPEDVEAICYGNMARLFGVTSSPSSASAS
jgi:predicted TIM-barrel fold metal-dependent hydrolase